MLTAAEPLVTTAPTAAADAGTVLVVDDELYGRELLTSMLRVGGYRSLTADSGEAALDVLGRERVDAVLLDVMMPGMNGYEVCRRIKEDARTAGVAVILVTALTAADEQVHGMDAGANDFVSKPVQRTALMARLRAHLRDKRQRDQADRGRTQLRSEIAELKQLERMRDDLTHMLVHDLKNPLHALQASLETLDGDAAAAGPGGSALRLVEDSAARLGKMVQNILSIRTMEQADIRLSQDAFRFVELLAGCLAGVRRAAEQVPLQLTQAVAPQADRFCGDRDLVARVLDNLLSNAVRLSKPGGDLRVEVEPHGADHVLVTVADRGPQLPRSMRERVFEKFVTGDDKRAVLGVNQGLGLTFCKLAVEAHGGRIWVEPRDGGGNRFRFTLARPEEDAERRTAPALQAVSA